mmetsp:Transcript_6562/g.18159  ORF Transcript_6562/g.18159 Transcript_6562/m.18159 type:complete len:283 (-) Transcript_6562:92-940(-)
MVLLVRGLFLAPCLGFFVQASLGKREERDLTPLPVVEHHLGRRVQVGVASLAQLSRAQRHLSQKVFGVFPARQLVGAAEILGLNPVDDLIDVLGGVFELFDAHDALEYGVRFGIALVGVDDSRAVDEEDSLHQRDVLPYLCLAWDGGHVANLLRSQRVDHGRLADVRVAHHAHRDVLLVGAHPRQLSQEAQERSLAKRIVDGGMEGDRRVLFRERAEPFLRDPRGHQIALVEHENQMLLPVVALQVGLKVPAASAHRVASIEYLQQHVAGINHLVQFAPDAP